MDHLSSNVIDLCEFPSIVLSKTPPGTTATPGLEDGACDNDLGLSKSTFARLLVTMGIPVPAPAPSPVFPSSSTVSSSLLRFLARLMVGVGVGTDATVASAAVAAVTF